MWNGWHTSCVICEVMAGKRHKMNRFFIAALAASILLVSCEKEKIVEVPVLADCPPSAPRGLFTINLDDRVTVTWWANPEDDINGYGVYRSVSYDGDYEFLRFVDVDNFPPDAVDYYFDDFDVDFNDPVQKFYAVTAIDYAGNESDFTPEEVTGTPRPEFYVRLFSNTYRPDSAGYDFSDLTHKSQPWDASDTDIYFRDNDGVAEIVVADNRVAIQDYGAAGSFDDLNWAPTEGWAPSGKVEAIVGHMYFLKLTEFPNIHYAKIYVTKVYWDDDMGEFEDIEFWSAYQLGPGNRDLSPGRPGAVDDREIAEYEPETERGSKSDKSVHDGRQSPHRSREGNMDSDHGM